MSLVITETQKDYPIPDEGLYEAVNIDAVRLGKIESPWGEKYMISLIFELDAEDSEGNRYVLGKRYTQSLNEKSNLRKDLERWRNKPFKPQELADGFDLESLIGVSCIVFVSHNETDKRTYANIDSILPPEKGDQGNPNWLQTRASGNYTRVINREDYQPPEEYAKTVNGEDA